MSKKYELIKVNVKCLSYYDKVLYRVKALRDIRVVNNHIDTIIKEGTLGGYIEGEQNLSQDDNSWVFEDGIIYGNAKLVDTALISGEVYGNALLVDSKIDGKEVRIFDNAIVMNSVIHNMTGISQDAVVIDSNIFVADTEGHTSSRVEIYDKANITNTTIKDGVSVFGDAIVKDSDISDCSISDTSKVIKCTVKDESHIYDCATVERSTIINSTLINYSEVYDSTIKEAKVFNDITICNSKICGEYIGNSNIEGISNIHSNIMKNKN